MMQLMKDNALKQERALKQEVKEWLKARGVTQKALAVEIGLTYGTLRNWLNSDLHISAEYSDKVRELMATPPESWLAASTELHYLNIAPFCPRFLLWNAAAGSNVDFRYTGLPGTSGELTLATWCTPIINAAIRDVLKRQKPATLKKSMREFETANAPVSSLYDDHGQRPETPEETARRVEGVRFRLPVVAGAVNPLFLRMAAHFASKAPDDFICEALNAAAESTAQSELASLLAGE